MALPAGAFAGQDVMALEAGHGRGYRGVVGGEEETALAVADGGAFPLEPGKPVFIRLFLRAVSPSGVMKWVFDHGNRDLSKMRRSAELQHSDATF